MNVSTALLLALATGSAMQGQRFSVGVKGGIPLTEPTRFSSDESRRYTVGPSFEIRWTRHLSVEFNPLYKRLGNSSGYRSPVPAAPPPGGYPSVIIGVIGAPGSMAGTGEFVWLQSRLRAHSAEFPVIGKYYFGDADRRWRPFAGTGYSFRKIWAKQQNQSFDFSSGHEVTGLRWSEFTFPSDTGIGVVFCTGLRFRKHGWTVAPEVRYSRWNATFPGPLNRNQIEFLTGLSF